MFCPDCGKEVPAGSKFCPGCGKSFGAASGSSIPQANPNDAEQNKGMAILAYILFFIPLLAGAHKTSEFVKYHTNQGIVLTIFYIGYAIVSGILTAILTALLIASGSYGLLALIGTILGLLWFVPLILCIIGIVNAVQGKMKPLPIIGKFTILK